MSFFNRLLPQPLLSLTLLATWMLLSNSLSPNQAVLGSALAIAIPWFSARFWPQQTKMRRPLLMIRYIGRVLFDIVVANIAVARLILGPQSKLKPTFIHYPLQLRDTFAITVLANTISLTPGTVSSDVAPDHSWLLIHGLDVGDKQALIEEIRARYEQPLKEIFES